MPGPSAPDVTRLLLAWREGDEGALEQLIPLVYHELRRIAHARIRAEHPGGTLETTALVNEAYLRLVDARQVPWKDRTHFFALCAQAMRRILVDAARTRASVKRGGDTPRVPFVEWQAVSPGRDAELVALDDALTELAQAEPRESQVVELRYFGGLSVEETAEVLGVSARTVARDWTMARLRLLRALTGGPVPQSRGGSRGLG
jgi:RNA polymerase sigma factor (TIGR02999 family)